MTTTPKDPRDYSTGDYLTPGRLNREVVRHTESIGHAPAFYHTARPGEVSISDTYTDVLTLDVRDLHDREVKTPVVFVSWSWVTDDSATGQQLKAVLESGEINVGESNHTYGIGGAFYKRLAATTWEQHGCTLFIPVEQDRFGGLSLGADLRLRMRTNTSGGNLKVHNPLLGIMPGSLF